MPLVPVFRRQRQGDFCRFKASLVYLSNSASLSYRETLVSKTKNIKLFPYEVIKGYRCD